MDESPMNFERWLLVFAVVVAVSVAIFTAGGGIAGLRPADHKLAGPCSPCRGVLSPRGAASSIDCCVTNAKPLDFWVYLLLTISAFWTLPTPLKSSNKSFSECIEGKIAHYKVWASFTSMISGLRAVALGTFGTIGAFFRPAS